MCLSIAKGLPLLLSIKQPSSLCNLFLQHLLITLLTFLHLGTPADCFVNACSGTCCLVSKHSSLQLAPGGFSLIAGSVVSRARYADCTRKACLQGEASESPVIHQCSFVTAIMDLRTAGVCLCYPCLVYRSATKHSVCRECIRTSKMQFQSFEGTVLLNAPEMQSFCSQALSLRTSNVSDPVLNSGILDS